MSRATLDSLIGATAYDERGEKIGKVEQIYIDSNSGSPTWAAVSTGLFRGDSLVPPAGAEHRADDDTLRLHVDKQQVKSAPHRDDGGRISAQSEQELFRHHHVDPRAAGWNTYGRHIEKEAVPVERVRPAVDEVTDEQAVSGTVRTERVEAEGIEDEQRRDTP